MRVRQLAGQVCGCGQYEFRIKDNGIGMSPEFAKKIFEPFERERTSTVSRIQGTGLGMAITKNIVDMMGGTIEVQTAQGKGSEFIIRVPLRVQAEHRPVEKITELEGLKALVVDDDFNTCDSVTKMLVKVGMRAEWTLSGKEAVLRARQSIEMSDVYHAYIIDWRLPDRAPLKSPALSCCNIRRAWTSAMKKPTSCSALPVSATTISTCWAMSARSLKTRMRWNSSRPLPI